MPQETMDVITSSFNDMGMQMIKIILILGVLSLPFAWAKGKRQKKEQERKAKKEEEKIQRAVQKALEEDRRLRK